MSSKTLWASLVLAAGVSCIGVSAAWCQPSPTSASLQVRVVNDDDRPAEPQLRVELLTGSGLAVTSGFTDSNGMAFLGGIRGGNYRLRVTGHDIDETTSGVFSIDPRERNHTETVTVKPNVAQSKPGAGPSSVAVVDLNVPKQAQNEFEKGAEALSRNKLDEARKQFDKAIASYPSYASAYNLLGITHMRQGEAGPAQQAFETAIVLNDRFALAYTNLAKLYFAQREFGRSEALLRKSVAVEPRDAETLTILAQLELMAGKYDQAAANARVVHDLPHKEYAIAHLVAARALRARNQPQEAMKEYKLFLREAPDSKSSPQARQELAQLEARKP